MMTDDAQRGECVCVLDLRGLATSLLLHSATVRVVCLLLLTTLHGFVVVLVCLLLLLVRFVRRRLSPIRRRFTTHSLVNRSKEVDAHAVAHSSRVLLGQSEYETRRVLVRVGLLLIRTVYVRTTFGLTKVRHVLWKHEVSMVVEWIATKQLGLLSQILVINRQCAIGALLFKQLVQALLMFVNELCRCGRLLAAHYDHKVDQAWTKVFLGQIVRSHCWSCAPSGLFCIAFFYYLCFSRRTLKQKTTNTKINNCESLLCAKRARIRI